MTENLEELIVKPPKLRVVTKKPKLYGSVGRGRICEIFVALLLNVSKYIFSRRIVY